jgi:transketolase
MLAGYERKHPELARELRRMERRELPDGWDGDLPVFESDPKGIAGRAASGKALNAIAKRVPWLIGGSADLAPSNKTLLVFADAGDFEAGNRPGRNLHFGVREHAMAGVLNGLALCNLRPYGGTFLVFSDYARPAIRLSALMGLPVIYIFTHDSISVGEDGPTHQPVEQLSSLRAVPGLVVIRPADAVEVVDAWRVIMRLKDRPAALVLSRQSLPVLDRERYAPSHVERGGYVLADCPDKPDGLLIATGSEVSLCVEAHERLKAEGVSTRVISLPSWELFERQSAEYRESVIPPGVPARLTVEQASTLGWERYAGPSGRMIGIDTFGASAPMADVQRHFGFTVEAVLEAIRRQVESSGRGS